MARRSSRPKRDRQAENPNGKRVLALIGLSLFALVDVALIAVALSGGFERSENDLAGTTPSVPTAIAPTETPEPSPSPEPPAATLALRVLSAVDESVAWRAERGSCDAQAVIEVTTDGGATWQQTVPSTTESREVLWLWAQDEDYAQAAVTAGDGCDVLGIRTFTGGGEWVAREDILADAVFVAGDGALVTPQGFAAPCVAPIDAATLGDATTVLCADGTVQSSIDGAEWSRAVVPGAVAIADALDGYALAVQGSASCQGIGVVYLSVEALSSGGAASDPRTCLQGAIDPALTELDVSDSSIWVWSGAEFSVAPAEELLS